MLFLVLLLSLYLAVVTYRMIFVSLYGVWPGLTPIVVGVSVDGPRPALALIGLWVCFRRLAG